MLQETLRDVEKKIGQALDRLVDATGVTIIAAYERRVRELEQEKALLSDRIAAQGAPRASFAQTYRTACDFLGNPLKLWHSGQIEDQRAVLKLAFAGHLEYARETGYRTAEFSRPFKMLGRNENAKSKGGGHFR